MAGDKPSDFVDEPAKAPSDRRRLLKIAGLGCAGIMVLCGLLFALGAFKAVSCCGDMQTMTQNTEQAAIFTHKFAQLIKAGDEAQAHKLLAPALNERLKKSDFSFTFGQHAPLIQDGVPMIQNISPVLPGDGKKLDDIKNVRAWNVLLRFYPKTLNESPNELVLKLRLSLAADHSPKTPGFVIEEIEANPRKIVYAQEEPALRVAEFQRVLQLEGTGGAYRFMAPSFLKTTTQADFDAFIQEHGQALKQGALAVRQVSYQHTPQGYVSDVVAALELPSGQRTIVNYQLVRVVQSWYITGLAPLVATVPSASEQVDQGSDAPPRAADAGADQVTPK